MLSDLIRWRALHCAREGWCVNACVQGSRGDEDWGGGTWRHRLPRYKIGISLCYNSQGFLDRTVLIFISLLHCQTHDGRLRSKSTQQSFFVLLFPCHLQLHHLWYNLTHGMIWDLSVLTGDNVARSMYHGWGAVCTVRSLHSFTLSRSDRSSADSRCLKLLYFTQRPLETLKTFSQSSGASQHLETHHPDIWGWHCHS